MMSSEMNLSKNLHPEHDTERFVIFRFEHSLGKGIKARIKAIGCTWNVLYHGWIAPIQKEQEIVKVIESTGIDYSTQTVNLPKGMIHHNPKIANKQSWIEILEEEIYKEETQLLEDVYRYDPMLRPEDFSQSPSTEEGKNQQMAFTEKNFHERWISLQKKRNQAERGKRELSHLESDKGEKFFDSNAPLLIADALIKEQFLWKQYRTLHYCSDAFWQWNGIKYIELSEWGMRKKIYDYLRDAKEVNKGLAANFNPTKFKVDQIIDALRAVCHQDHHPSSGAIWLDGRSSPDPKYLISFQNGLLNLEDWLENPLTLLMPHTPLFLNFNALDFQFNPEADSPHSWNDFLNSIWPEDLESQQTLQEWMGYILTHDTRLHKILLIIGPPRSGKGTIGRCILDLLGAFNVIGPTLSSLAGEFGLQPFLNKMLAVISDARLSNKGNNSTIIERLLSISGEDPLTVNRKFLTPLTLQLSTRIMIMSNEIPDMRDASGALSKRYTVLTLKKSWLDTEDTSLSYRLRAELPSILLWALKGLARLQQRGRFKQPPSSAQTIEDLEAITSPIKAFALEKCEFKPTGIVSVGSLFSSWRCWCNLTGYPNPGNLQSFGKNLRAAFPNIETTRTQDGYIRERCYKGITLKSLSPASADVRDPGDYT